MLTHRHVTYKLVHFILDVEEQSDVVVGDDGLGGARSRVGDCANYELLDAHEGSEGSLQTYVYELEPCVASCIKSHYVVRSYQS